jgi:hypothetical protein
MTARFAVWAVATTAARALTVVLVRAGGTDRERLRETS